MSVSGVCVCVYVDICEYIYIYIYIHINIYTCIFSYRSNDIKYRKFKMVYACVYNARADLHGLTEV